MRREVCNKDIGGLYIISRDRSTKILQHLWIASVFTSTLSFVSWKPLKTICGVVIEPRLTCHRSCRPSVSLGSKVSVDRVRPRCKLTTPGKSSLSVCLVPLQHHNEHVEHKRHAGWPDLLISSKKASIARLPFGFGIAGGDGDCSYVGNVTLVNRLAHLRRFECAHGTGVRIRSGKS
jgi:hypothetical protein